MELDSTHDPARQSWVTSANGHDMFPVQNLPFGVFSDSEARHIGVAIGDQILDLTRLEASGVLTPGGDHAVFRDGSLNAFMSLGPGAWRRARRAICDLLTAGAKTPQLAQALVRQDAVRLHLPFFVRSFTDFYASRAHATNVGAMFRDPDKALMPNWLHMPVGYNGRASGVVVSGTDVVRPMGQILPPGATMPVFAPTARLDLELELGAVVGVGTPQGVRIDPLAADESIFGYVLLNDWSARDIQVWEYQPLGPFLSKAFATTISPWVVTRDALAPFRVPMPARAHPLLPHLATDAPQNHDISLEARLVTGQGDAALLCRTNARHLYYSSAQMLAHHASSGAPMCPGDLLGSGTISGPEPGSLGSLLEITKNGTRPLEFPRSGARGFLQDGDRVIITGQCEGPYRIGFGRCEGTILPANPD
jgi:fumarylacetoacetase